MVKEINAKFPMLIRAFDPPKICRALHFPKMSYPSSQKIIINVATIAEARLWILRTSKMFLMISLRFFKYLVNATMAKMATVPQQMGKAIRPKVESFDPKS